MDGDWDKIGFDTSHTLSDRKKKMITKGWGDSRASEVLESMRVNLNRVL